MQIESLTKQQKPLYTHNFCKEKEYFQKRLRKLRKFRHNILKVRRQRKEVLVPDLVDDVLHKHKSSSSNGISSRRKKKLRSTEVAIGGVL